MLLLFVTAVVGCVGDGIVFVNDVDIGSWINGLADGDGDGGDGDGGGDDGGDGYGGV